MLTTDLALRFDPSYEKMRGDSPTIPNQLAGRAPRGAWFKLTHRDLGPRARYLGPEVPAEDQIWQDLDPRRESPARSTLKSSPRLQEQDLGFRALRVGAGFDRLERRRRRSAVRPNGERRMGRAFVWLRRRDWEANQPTRLAKVLKGLESIQTAFNTARAAERRSRSRT